MKTEILVRAKDARGERRLRPFCRAMVVALLGLLLWSQDGQAAWKFGVMADTQWSPTDGVNNSVAINVIDAVNQQFIAAGVDLVLQVGDLTNDGSTAGLQTRANRTAALQVAGIAFYPLRGNHESSRTAAQYFPTAFPNLPGTPGGGGSSPAGAEGLTYAFVYHNAKFILLDQFTLPDSTTRTINDYQPWISSQLAAADHEHAFVLSHKNLLGQNHKDNLFGSSNDSNTTWQNNFLASLQANGVRYALSGHDHLYHRSRVTSPDGLSAAQQIICQSDSYKFYTPSTPFSPREAPISQELNAVGYYIFTVDGPRVIGEYYATAPFGSVPANPTWTLRDTFGYSLNGREFLVPRGGALTVVADQIAPGGGFAGTAMSILDGTNAVTGATSDGRQLASLVTTGWSARPAVGNLRSDILSLWGLDNALGSAQADTYALSMTFDAAGLTVADVAARNVFLATADGQGGWLNAVDANFGGSNALVVGPYQPGYGLGTHGVDLDTGAAWAVVNYDADFAVVVLPRPIVIAAGVDWDWIYQNATATTQGRHKSVLTIEVTNDPNGNTSYAAQVTRSASSMGQVVIESTADPLVWNIRGGQYGVAAVGAVTLDITVTGDEHGGSGATTANMAVRWLGDITGNGAVALDDKLELNKRLNGLPTSGYVLRHFDLNGGGSVGLDDKVIMNKILNGLPVQ